MARDRVINGFGWSILSFHLHFDWPATNALSPVKPALRDG